MNLEQPIGPGFFIFFQEPTYATDQPIERDEGREKRKKYVNEELESLLAKYEIVEEHVSEQIFEQTIEVVDSMARARAEATSRAEMRDILGLDRKVKEPKLVEAYIEYELIQIYRRMRQDEEFLLIILCTIIS